MNRVSQEFGGIPGRCSMIPKKDKADLKRAGIKEVFLMSCAFEKMIQDIKTIVTEGARG